MDVAGFGAAAAAAAAPSSSLITPSAIVPTPRDFHRVPRPAFHLRASPPTNSRSFPKKKAPAELLSPPPDLSKKGSNLRPAAAVPAMLDTPRLALSLRAQRRQTCPALVRDSSMIDAYGGSLCSGSLPLVPTCHFPLGSETQPAYLIGFENLCQRHPVPPEVFCTV